MVLLILAQVTDVTFSICKLHLILPSLVYQYRKAFSLNITKNCSKMLLEWFLEGHIVSNEDVGEFQNMRRDVIPQVLDCAGPL